MYLIFLMMISLLGCKISGGDDRAGFTIVRGGDDGVTAKGHGVEIQGSNNGDGDLRRCSSRVSGGDCGDQCSVGGYQSWPA